MRVCGGCKRVTRRLQAGVKLCRVRNCIGRKEGRKVLSDVRVGRCFGFGLELRVAIRAGERATNLALLHVCLHRGSVGRSEAIEPRDEPRVGVRPAVCFGVSVLAAPAHPPCSMRARYDVWCLGCRCLLRLKRLSSPPRFFREGAIRTPHARTHAPARTRNVHDTVPLGTRLAPHSPVLGERASGRASAERAQSSAHRREREDPTSSHPPGSSRSETRRALRSRR